jgi:hypothetical protein
MADYSEEEMDRMVEDSKTVHKIVEFANGEDVVESIEKIAAMVIAVAENFKETTDLSHQEVAAAMLGSLGGVIAAWAIASTGGDLDK